MFLIKVIGIPLAIVVLVAGIVVFGTVVRALYLRRTTRGQSDGENGTVRAAFTFYKRVWIVYASVIAIAFVYIVARSVWGLITVGKTPW